VVLRLIVRWDQTVLIFDTECRGRGLVIKFPDAKQRQPSDHDAYLHEGGKKMIARRREDGWAADQLGQREGVVPKSHNKFETQRANNQRGPWSDRPDRSRSAIHSPVAGLFPCCFAPLLYSSRATPSSLGPSVPCFSGSRFNFSVDRRDAISRWG
jgi:hypothetical protein